MLDDRSGVSHHPLLARLLVQNIILADIKGKIEKSKDRVTGLCGPVRGESIGDWRIPLTKGQ